MSASEVSLDSVTFVNNAITKMVGFPTLRHNVYVSNNSEVVVSNPKADTGASNFIYLANTTGDTSQVSGVAAPLFVPRLTSASPTDLSKEMVTTFVLSGDNLYPCGLQIAIYKGGTSNEILVCVVLAVGFFFFLFSFSYFFF
jgi:hypothetical protein